MIIAADCADYPRFKFCAICEIRGEVFCYNYRFGSVRRCTPADVAIPLTWSANRLMRPSDPVMSFTNSADNRSPGRSRGNMGGFPRIRLAPAERVPRSWFCGTDSDRSRSCSSAAGGTSRRRSCRPASNDSSRQSLRSLDSGPADKPAAR